ncbi:MAG: T9SS type A sorting domain-containing protein [Lewinellaceae bacterium]|nr:T9SS type A sorting domain-containing protein [Lewinellaceae bacterium]
MRVIIPVFFCLMAFSARAGMVIDTLTPPNGNIIYSPDCATGGLGTLFGFVIPPNPGATYRWQGPDGFIANQASFTPADTGLYILTVTADNCPSVPDSINVQYFEPPTVLANASSDFYCPNENTFLLSATANTDVLFWRRLLPNGNSIYLGGGDSLPVAGSLLGLLTERILVTANGAYGCEGADTLVLRRLGGLTASNTLLECPGDTIQISAAGEGSFLWNTGDTSSLLQAIVDSAGTFSLQFDDGQGCVVVDSLSIFIQGGAYVSLSADQPELCRGDSTLLRAAGGASYMWEDGSVKDSLLVAPLENDTFRVTITTAEGCVVKKELPIRVISYPVAALSIFPPAICQGDTVHILLANADSTYYNYRESPDINTVYALTIDNQGCAVTFTDSLAVYPRPALAIDGPEQVCEGESAQLLASVSQDSLLFLWNTASRDSIINEIPLPPFSTYSVTVTEPVTGCQAADTLKVQASPLPVAPVVECSATYEDVFFVWNYDPALQYSMQIPSGPGGTLLNDSTLRVANLSTGQEVVFSLAVTDTLGCAASSQQACTTAECQLSLTLDTLRGLCLYPNTEPVNLTAEVSGSLLPGSGFWEGSGLVGDTGLFDPFVAGPGQQVLHYTYEEGPCQIGDSISLSVYQPLSDSMVTCEASSNRVRFSWPALPQDSLYEVQVLTGQAGYFVTPHSFLVEGLISEEEVAIAIRAYGEGPCGLVTVEKTCRAAFCERPGRGVSKVICAGDSTLLAASPVTAVAFNWQPAAGLSCTDCPFPMASPASTVDYTRTAIDSLGCIYTSTLTLGVEEWPPALIPDTLYACADEPFFFCLPNGQYQWIGPDGYSFSGHCLSFSSPGPEITGTYTLTAYLADSCQLSREVALAFRGQGGCAVASRPVVGSPVIFPNPASGQAWVSTGTEQPMLIEILTGNGQVLHRLQPDGPVAALPVDGLKAGLYFVRIKNPSGTQVHKLVLH